MLARLISKPAHFRLLTLIPSNFHSHQRPIQYHDFHTISRFLSTYRSGDGNGRDPSFNRQWNFSQESDAKFGSPFSESSGIPSGASEGPSPAAQEEEESWWKAKDVDESDFYGGNTKEVAVDSSGAGCANVGGEKPWRVNVEENGVEFGEVTPDVGEAKTELAAPESESTEDLEKLKEEEKQLTAILKGPDCAFGDLIAASGITDAMLDSLIALKDFEGVEGLPPLSEIEDIRYEKNTKKSSRADIERIKQEEEAKARVRQVDEKGRAYGTGRRKCSVARVWVQPGAGKFTINDKQFDVYFPMLDHRAALLRPFSETKTLGLWDINCTVKGGGVSGQVGAIQLGISRALQNWEPELRPPLRAAGFLTRDSRVVERKKPGKAKARKSFQWVKR